MFLAGLFLTVKLGAWKECGLAFNTADKVSLGHRLAEKPFKHHATRHSRGRAVGKSEPFHFGGNCLAFKVKNLKQHHRFFHLANMNYAHLLVVMSNRRLYVPYYCYVMESTVYNTPFTSRSLKPLLI